VLVRLDELSDADRLALSERGIRIGREVVWLRDSFEPRQRWIRQALARAFEPRDVSALPALQDALSFAAPASIDADWLEWLGFLVLGQRAVRADVLDRVSKRARRLARTGPFALASELLDWLDGDALALGELLRALGYRRGSDGAYRRARRRRRKARPT